MNNSKNAQDIFNNGFNCAQAVLSSYSNKYNLDENTAKRISCGFGGGCARQSLTCGAVSGAYMVIGLKYGKTLKDDAAARDNTYQKINELSQKFKYIHKSVNCGELLGVDIGTEEGQNYFKQNSLHENKCTDFVMDACTILDEMGF